MAISEATVERVRSAADIREVVGHYRDLRRQGAEWVCCCPFHDEKTPSFHVNERKNTYYCHGSCHEGGDAIKFIMKLEGLDFIGAVKFLARMFNIVVEETEDKRTDEQRKAYERRETAFAVLADVQRFFEEELRADTLQAAQARSYAFDRWPREFCEEYGIGYASGDANALVAYIRSKGHNAEVLKDLGMVFLDDHREPKCQMKHRVTIPIRDMQKRVTGFTCRTLSANPEIPKYKNSSNSLVYQKDRTLFGADRASNAAHKAGALFLVEGAPDVLRCQSLGIDNVMAPLGSSLTEEQLKTLKRVCDTLVFIPDSDPPKGGNAHGAGDIAVMKNGRAAIEAGFNVRVRELPKQYADPDKKEQVKADPDSLITSKEVFADLPETDFIIWYDRLVYPKTDDNTAAVSAAITDVCSLLAANGDTPKTSLYLPKLTQLHGNKAVWRQTLADAVNHMQRNAEQEKPKDASPESKSGLGKYGFFIADNCYCKMTKDDDVVRLSNFLMLPLYYIPDNSSAVFIFRLVNDEGRERIVSFDPDELVNIAPFRRKLIINGNFIWRAKLDDLMKVQEYILKDAPTAQMVRTMGWQKEGVYAWGNGVVYGQRFFAADDYGMAKVPQIATFFLPAFSVMHRDDTSRYAFERRFVYEPAKNPVTLPDFARRVGEVFGSNGKIGLAFAMAVIFRDVVFSHSNFFPILNIYGQKGSGKSKLAMTLRSLWIGDNTPVNIESQTFAACNSSLAQVANAIVHFDEYKNTIPANKLEMLKGVWDGVGRGKMRDGQVEQAEVQCGLVLTGQEMPTLDIALFSRTVHLSFSVSEFTPMQRVRFKELEEIRKKGCSHFVSLALRQRELFEDNYPHQLAVTSKELAETLKDDPIEDRILDNWAVVLAAYRTLQMPLELPYTAEEMFGICVKGIREQNAISQGTDEIAGFWKFVSIIFQEGRLYEGCDFNIRQKSRIKLKGATDFTMLGKPTRLLLIRPKRIIHHYRAENRSNQIVMSADNIEGYLKKSKGFIGETKCRFKRIVDGVPQRTPKIVNGQTVLNAGELIYDISTCYIFDYDLVSRLYDFDLMTYARRGKALNADLNETDTEEEDSASDNGNDECSSSNQELPF